MKTRRRNRSRRNKTRKLVEKEMSKKVKDIVKIFQQYPIYFHVTLDF